MSEDFVAHARRRRKHAMHEQNRERIASMLDPTFGPAFLQDHPHCRSVETATKTVFLNPVDYDFIDYRKWCLSLSNEDILNLMRSLSNGAENITLATLNRKLKGHVDFTTSEVVLLARILELSPEEILTVFRLYP